MDSALVFQAAGLLLGYPDDELLDRLDMIEAALRPIPAAHHFAPTIAHLRSMPIMELQSWHVQEFDLSRRHALHLTYWTNGDTRQRGEALAAIKQVYRHSGLLVDLQGELPDYLPMVLEFTATGDAELGRGLLNRYRASLELLKMGLMRDNLPQAGVVAAICDELGGPSPSTLEDVKRLLDGPPSETVGIGSTLLPYPTVRS